MFLKRSNARNVFPLLFNTSLGTVCWAVSRPAILEPLQPCQSAHKCRYCVDMVLEFKCKFERCSNVPHTAIQICRDVPSLGPFGHVRRVLSFDPMSGGAAAGAAGAAAEAGGEAAGRAGEKRREAERSGEKRRETGS